MTSAYIVNNLLNSCTKIGEVCNESDREDVLSHSESFMTSVKDLNDLKGKQNIIQRCSNVSRNVCDLATRKISDS